MGAAETKNPSDEGPSLLSEENFSFIDVENEESTTCEPDELRIMLLGRTGAGKSSCANTIMGEKGFQTSCSPHADTKKCATKTKVQDGVRITVIDTPGVCDTDRSRTEVRDEILSGFKSCSHGPTIFVLVLRIGRFTEEEKSVVKSVQQWFGDMLFSYMVLLFTHGDDLEDGMTIGEYVHENSDLQELVDLCRNRVHVIDNKYWTSQYLSQNLQYSLGHTTESLQKAKEFQCMLLAFGKSDLITSLESIVDQQQMNQGPITDEAISGTEETRNNSFQIKRLMTTINKMVKENKVHYTKAEQPCCIL